MSLSKPTMKTTIYNALVAAYGTPDDAAKTNKLAEALSNAFYDILTAQAAVKVNGVTGTGPDGGPLPITDQPGVIE